MESAVVSVYLFAAAKAAVGQEMLTVAPGPFLDIIAGLKRSYPAFAAIEPRCSYLLNSTAIHDNPVVAAGDRIDVLPPFAGG